MPLAKLQRHLDQAAAQHLRRRRWTRWRRGWPRSARARRRAAQGPAARRGEDAQRAAHCAPPLTCTARQSRAQPRVRTTIVDGSRGRAARARRCRGPAPGRPGEQRRPQHAPAARRPACDRSDATRMPSAAMPGVMPNGRDGHRREHEPDAEHRPREAGLATASAVRAERSSPAMNDARQPVDRQRREPACRNPAADPGSAAPSHAEPLPPESTDGRRSRVSAAVAGHPGHDPAGHASSVAADVDLRRRDPR